MNVVYGLGERREELGEGCTRRKSKQLGEICKWRLDNLDGTMDDERCEGDRTAYHSNNGLASLSVDISDDVDDVSTSESSFFFIAEDVCCGSCRQRWF